MGAMTEDGLIAHIELLESQSQDLYGSNIADEQAKAIRYYSKQPIGNEEEGRSTVISSDVYDVVEGMTPLILKPFVSSDDIVKFTPEGAEDEEAAQQETDYINYVVTQKNNVFENLVAWVKTGLLQKNGVVKYWWAKSTRREIERYYGLPDDLYASLLQDSVEVIEHTEIQYEQTGELLHDVVVRSSEDIGEAKYAVVPPEEFRIHASASSVDPKQAVFVEHACYVTISALREMGYDVADDINDANSTGPRTSPQYTARHAQDALNSMGGYDGGSDPTMREVLFRESYIRVDYDGDGIAELRKVCIVGTTILANEETEEIPFCAWTPSVNAFKFYGGCPADETIDTQEVKTTLLRQTLNNIYTINNNRTFVGPHVNIDDFVDNQIGGIIRIRQGAVGDQIREATVTPISGVTMPMIEYLDSSKENRTGWTRYNQGTDSNSLNKTATGVRLIQEAGNERIGLVSRSFAELGIKNLMLGIHGLCRRHSSKAQTLKLRGKWVTIDPRGWKKRFDMSVSVGLGNSDKQMQMQGAQLLLAEQKQLLQTGIVTPQNLYNAAAKLANAVGEKSPDQYFKAPPQPEMGADGQPMPEEQPAPPDPMENPEVLFKVAESKRKDKELEIKERELAIKEQEFALRKKESDVLHLTNHARLMRELNDAEMPEVGAEMPEVEQPEAVEPEETIEQKALAMLVNGQNELASLMTSIAEGIAASNERLARYLEEADKPKRLHVQKQADGSFVGTKEIILN